MEVTLFESRCVQLPAMAACNEWEIRQKKTHPFGAGWVLRTRLCATHTPAPRYDNSSRNPQSFCALHKEYAGIRIPVKPLATFGCARKVALRPIRA